VLFRSISTYSSVQPKLILPDNTILMTSLPASSMLASAHRDVLEAPIPNTPEGIARLVEELQRRAKAAVGYKSWMDALLLYSKAMELVPNDAPLHSNRSLVHYQMGQFEESRRDAQQAVELDGRYMKGYWRLAQALLQLHRTEEASAAIQSGLKLEPTNKVFLKEKQKLKQQQQEEADLLALCDLNKEAAVPAPEPVIPSKSKPANKKTPAASITMTNTSKSIDDAGEFTKSDHVKGYKIVNGKKTSFFHNEMTEQVKELIGDIAPKRIEELPKEETAAVPQGASAWNKAGTWEERDVTVWAKESLERALMETSFTFPSEWGAFASITAAKVEGTASYATVRGKKRYIYEFNVSVDWTVTNLPNHGVCTGTMTFPDVDGTCELGDGYEMTNYNVKEGVPGITPLLDRFVKNGGLRDSLHSSVDDWVRYFKETF